ncbi:MAG TPA: hypothetical protein VKK79_19085, partial [Candidatus Lokiarchaeia archaeon]|nr:hypothetical protein [Candidatus Lokiarchaeia archaeon]
NASVLAAAGISPANLILWYYNETTSTWVPLTGTVNVTEQSVTVQIMHLSTFGLAPVQSSFDPHLLGVIFGISAVAIVAIAAALNYRRAGKSGNPRSPQKLKLKRNPRSEDKTPDAPVE